MMYVKANKAECLEGIAATESAIMRSEHQRCAIRQAAQVQPLITPVKGRKNHASKQRSSNDQNRSTIVPIPALGNGCGAIAPPPHGRVTPHQQ